MKTITIKGQARTQKVVIHFKDKYPAYRGNTFLGYVWGRNVEEATTEAQDRFRTDKSQVHVREVR